jgi:molecular chaperone GrpE
MGDEPPSEPSAPAPPAAPEAPTPKPPAEDWETRFKYLFADFENFRRRTERERESIGRQSRASVLRELLPLIEAFRAAHTAAQALGANDPLRKGVELLDLEWEKFLKHQGIEPVARPGGAFRSDEAEAVGEAAATDAAPAGTVAEVVQQGYRFFGGLLRPAKVIVSRAPPEAVTEPSADDGSTTEGDGSS